MLAVGDRSVVLDVKNLQLQDRKCVGLCGRGMCVGRQGRGPWRGVGEVQMCCRVVCEVEACVAFGEARWGDRGGRVVEEVDVFRVQQEHVGRKDHEQCGVV